MGGALGNTLAWRAGVLLRGRRKNSREDGEVVVVEERRPRCAERRMLRGTADAAADAIVLVSVLFSYLRLEDRYHYHMQEANPMQFEKLN